MIAENPFCTTKRISQRLKVAFATAQRAINTLESAGILTEVTGSKRGRVYCAEKLLGSFRGAGEVWGMI